ncbi:hypothetical protein ACJ2A9_02950 [Anaerobacillus sp. MEB173]|uniref:hypothetical protein n=1 Tax=Anaerobacillus sp. MEB173 TaxID=3383345 RepID=UPI003F92F721
MVTRQIVEMNQYFTNDTKPGFIVLYEKMITNEISFTPHGIQEGRTEIEEYVKILKDNEGNTLTEIESYRLDNNYQSLEDLLYSIKQLNKEFFKVKEMAV